MPQKGCGLAGTIFAEAVSPKKQADFFQYFQHCFRIPVHALTNVTLRFIVRLADKRIEQVLSSAPGVAARGMDVKQGYVINQAVADAHGLPYVPLI